MTLAIWNYRMRCPKTGLMKIQPRQCTAEGIRTLGGTMISGTMTVVPDDALDSSGHLRPVKLETDWLS